MRNSTWRVAFSMSAIALLTVAACAAKVGGTAAPTAPVEPATTVATSSTSTTRTATTSGTTTRTTASRSSASAPNIPPDLDLSSALNDLTSALSGLQSVIPGFGELPSNWPQGVKLPAGSTITFAYGSGGEVFVTFNTDESPTDAFNYMHPQFITAGWNQVSRDVDTDYVSAKYTKGSSQLDFDLIRLGNDTQGAVNIKTE